MSEMVDSTLKKELIAHNIYSAWQFIEYTENASPGQLPRPEGYPTVLFGYN